MEQENNRSMLWAIIAGVILVIAVLFLLTQNTATQDPDPTNTINTTTGNDDIEENIDEDNTFQTTFNLEEQNNSGQNGTVVLSEVGNQVQVTINLSNPNSAPEPAHIHIGSCPNPGAVLHHLSDVVNGTSVTLLDTTLADLNARGALAVNIHKSAAESGIYYSCGNLDF